MTNVTYIALSDVTPNRGRIEYVGTDENEAQDAIDASGRVYTIHPESAEPSVGMRAYHDDEHAWVSAWQVSS